MALAGNKFYVLGFCLDRTKTSITIVQSLFENSITTGHKVTITYKPGAKAQDFIELLPPGITIHEGSRDLRQFRLTKLEPRLIKLNSHIVECYDLENRVLNYLVTYDRESSINEYTHNSDIVFLSKDVDNEDSLKSILDQSIYFKWRTLPLGEYFSYPLVNTHPSTGKGNGGDSQGNNGGNSGTNTGNGNGDEGNIEGINIDKNVPLYFSKYAKYRMEYSKVLIGFYEELKKHVPEFSLYIFDNGIDDLEQLASDRITIKLDNIGDIERRPYMTDEDLIASVATLSLAVKTSDQLKYMHIKNCYQDLLAISNLARFSVKDTHGLPWMTHVEWEPARDETNMKEIVNEDGKFSYQLNLRCSLYYYVVIDALYNVIKKIDINYVNLNNGSGLNFQIK